MTDSNALVSVLCVGGSGIDRMRECFNAQKWAQKELILANDLKSAVSGAQGLYCVVWSQEHCYAPTALVTLARHAEPDRLVEVNSLEGQHVCSMFFRRAFHAVGTDAVKVTRIRPDEVVVAAPVSTSVERVREFVPHTSSKRVGSFEFKFHVRDAQAAAALSTFNGAEVINFATNNLLRPGDTVVDVGAHHGFYSLCFADAVGEFGKVLAFEPLPECADTLRANLTLNGIGNVCVLGTGLKADRGTLRMHAPSLCPVYELSHYDCGFDVPAAMLDDFEHEKPDFIRISCAGYESEVLSGASNVLASCPNFSLRVDPPLLRRHGSSAGELLRLVRWKNYMCWYTTKAGVIAPWIPETSIEHATTLLAKRRTD